MIHLLKWVLEFSLLAFVVKVVPNLEHEADVDLPALVKDGLSHEFIGGVQLVIGLAKSKQGRLCSHLGFKKVHPWDRATHLGEEHLLVEGLLQDGLCNHGAWGIERNSVRLGPIEAAAGKRHLRVVRADGPEVLSKESLDDLGVLVRDESASYLDRRLLRHNRLDTFALKAPPHASHLKRWSRRGSLKGSEAFLADKAFDSVILHARLEQGVRKLGHLPLLLTHDRHIIVEARNIDTSVGIMQAGDHVREQVQSIGSGSSKRSAVQVRVRRLHFHLQRCKTSQGGEYSRLLLRYLSPVGRKAQVGCKFLRVLVQEVT
mmetsp:Transcript_12744/g.24066  ORF Transcript_12744/g.24066 Transcript_12744/m.24066 type:complete len:317 (-) Transcript_12744:711-1661(-)